MSDQRMLISMYAISHISQVFSLMTARQFSFPPSKYEQPKAEKSANENPVQWTPCLDVLTPHSKPISQGLSRDGKHPDDRNPHGTRHFGRLSTVVSE